MKGTQQHPMMSEPVACVQIMGLEELLNTGHGLVAEAAQPAAGIPHASEAYIRIIEKARTGQFPAKPTPNFPLCCHVFQASAAPSLIKA